jgi:hypothetical protein
MDKIMKAIGFFSWPVTALASIHIGLKALGYDITDMDFIRTNLAFLYQWMPYVVGIAGVLSAISFVMVLTGCMGDDGCDWSK